MIQIPYLVIWSMLLSGQALHTTQAIQVTFFNFEDPVLVHTLYYRMKATYHPLLIGIFHEQISVQHVGHNVLHLHVVKRLSSH